MLLQRKVEEDCLVFTFLVSMFFDPLRPSIDRLKHQKPQAPGLLCLIHDDGAGRSLDCGCWPIGGPGLVLEVVRYITNPFKRSVSPTRSVFFFSWWGGYGLNGSTEINRTEQVFVDVVYCRLLTQCAQSIAGFKKTWCHHPVVAELRHPIKVLCFQTGKCNHDS